LAYPDPVTGGTKNGKVKNIEDSELMLDFITGNHLAVVRDVIDGINANSDDSTIAALEDFSLTPSRKEGDEPYKIRLHLIRIGELAIMGINGELYTALGLKIQEASPLENTIVVNHDASLVMDNPAYIFDDETISLWESAGRVAIPGRNFRGKAGTIERSLVEHTKSMFDKIFHEEGE
jgi:hypothetical protein